MFFRVRPSTFIIGLSAFAVAAFVAWSLWADIDQVTRARGEVIPSGRVQVIQSLEGGTIEEILVREGDRVKKGQLLVRLDEVRPGAAVEESQARVAGLMAKMARIQAELFDRPLSFPPQTANYPEFVRTQRELYHRRRDALHSHIATLRQMLGLVREELAMNTPLVQSGDVSRSEVLRMQRSVSDLEGQIVTGQTEYLQELQTQYAETEQELATAQQQLMQRGSQLKGTEIRAPADGVIVHIRVTTIGGVLGPGDEVLQLVPSADELIVEARISPADIAFIRAGQDASVKFDAYDSSIYGAASGKVSYVSADTLSEETKDGTETFYRVHIKVDTRPMRPREVGELIQIQPGMTATAEIVTGDSTVFRYLTKPILKTASDSLGER